MSLRASLGRLLAVALAGAVLPVSAARAEEGMWTFENFPLDRVNATYGLRLDQAWLDRVRGAVVRLNGCSGSVVSPQGLVLTNAHCVSACLQDLAARGGAELEAGVTDAAREDERTCPGQTAEILIETTDVTDRMERAGADRQGADLIQALNREETAIIDEACGADPGLSCQVVSFYRGGRYALYKHRLYRDVRLVFTPEPAVALFGGDPDNFSFPRYALDFGFLRIYEDGAPLATPQHLRWNPAQPRDGEPTLIAGNPGSTLRQLPVSSLMRLRDQTLPIQVAQTSELRGRLLQYSESDGDQAEAAATALSNTENTFKVFYGQLTALLDDALFAAKRDQEEALRQAVAADPELAALGDPWADMARTQETARELYPALRQLELTAGQGSSLYTYARVIVRAVKERAKPVEERQAGYADRYFAGSARRLAAEKPIDPELERIYLTFWLQKTRELLTVDDPNVRALLGDESPEALAARLVDGTGLDDPRTRVAMLEMTPEQLAATGDPLIAFVLANDTAAQLARTQWELAVAAPAARAQERIARAGFAVHGDSVYPDATFTLRLSFGKIAGWTEGRRTVAPFTRIAGLYDRATGVMPFQLPDSWIEAREAVDPQTVFAFLTTNDTTGGNSGSPVLNGRGEVIGTAFDGNIHSIAGAFAYDGRLNRSIAVSAAAMTEALRTVYGQTQLLKELGLR